MIDQIATAFMCGVTFVLVIIAFICLIDARIESSKPKRPQNIRAYAGKYLIGECPKCKHELTNCDGKNVSGISYCPCCGTKIRFPYYKPQMYGVKSVSLEEYSKEVKK